MNNFSHIIFDLDGTLTDNTRGIAASLDYTLKKMQLEGFGGKMPPGFIGPPLQQAFKHFYGLNESNAKIAVEYFREYYSVNGLLENDPYPGISGMLETLHFEGKKLYVATAKLEKYALLICEHFGFDKYIIRLTGADYNGDFGTKGNLIAQLLQSEQIVPSKNIVMVGDTTMDIEGGKENGLATIAVTYGFGNREDLHKAAPDHQAESVEELFDMLS